MKVNLTIRTDGKGSYTKHAMPMVITSISLNYYDSGEIEEDECGELYARFDTDAWPSEEIGMPYGDRTWLREFLAGLEFLGGDPSGVGYSEAGMQRDDCVSLDVGYRFLSSTLGRKLVDEWKDNMRGIERNKAARKRRAKQKKSDKDQGMFEFIELALRGKADSNEAIIMLMEIKCRQRARFSTS